MEKGSKVELTIEAPDWAISGGFPEDLLTVTLEDLDDKSVKVAEWIFPADTNDGPYEIYRTASGINVRVLSK